MFGLSNDLYFFGKVLGHPKNDFIIRMVCILFAQIEWPENKMQISLLCGIQPKPHAAFIQTRLVTFITSPDFLCEGGGEGNKILSRSGSTLNSGLALTKFSLVG